MMTSEKFEDRLRELGYTLGEPPKPLGAYVRCVVAGGLAFTAGHGPFGSSGETAFTGQVGGQLTVSEGQEAARLAAVACLASLKAELGSLERVDRIVKLLGFVNCAPGFSNTSAVIDGASELIGTVFGPRGVHARAAIGTSVLPRDIPVEIELIASVADTAGVDGGARDGND
jgi:enamine deaminase RidA (YjgF/YER057c/UK114 family)